MTALRKIHPQWTVELFDMPRTCRGDIDCCRSVDGVFGATTTWFGFAAPGFGQIAVVAANSCRLGGSIRRHGAGNSPVRSGNPPAGDQVVRRHGAGNQPTRDRAVGWNGTGQSTAPFAGDGTERNFQGKRAVGCRGQPAIIRPALILPRQGRSRDRSAPRGQHQLPHWPRPWRCEDGTRRHGG